MPLRMNEWGCWTNYSKSNIYYPNSNNQKKEADYEVCSICKGILIKIKIKGSKIAELRCSLCGLPALIVKKTKKKSKKRKS